MPHPPPIHVVAQPDGTATYGLWNPGGQDTPLPELTESLERLRRDGFRVLDHQSDEEPCHAQ